MSDKHDDVEQMWEDHYSNPNRGSDDFNSVYDKWQEKKEAEDNG